MATFGQRLRQLRESRGWTQQELAARAHVPYITIYRVEKGQHDEPRLNVAAKLARALGVSLDVLADTYGDVVGGVENVDADSETAPTEAAMVSA